MRKFLHTRLMRDLEPDLQYFETYLQQSILSDEPVVTGSVSHLVSAGGKRVRPLFAMLAAQANDYNLKDMLPLLAALELLHTGSLIHDDIIDGADMRRGIPTANAIHGNKTAIFIGDYLIGRAFELISVYEDERIYLAVERTVTEMTRGELRQIADFYRLDQTVKDYFYRIERKTALLFATSCEAGACVSGAPQSEVDAFRRYGYYLGMAFQIIDDILDLTADEKTLGKPVGSDLHQGNLSLPVIIALHESSQRDKLVALIESLATADEAAKDRMVAAAIDLIKQSSALRSADRIAQRFIDKAMIEVDRIMAGKNNRSLESVLREIAGYMTKRKS